MKKFLSTLCATALTASVAATSVLTASAAPVFVPKAPAVQSDVIQIRDRRPKAGNGPTGRDGTATTTISAATETETETAKNNHHGYYNNGYYNNYYNGYYNHYWLPGAFVAGALIGGAVANNAATTTATTTTAMAAAAATCSGAMTAIGPTANTTIRSSRTTVRVSSAIRPIDDRRNQKDSPRCRQRGLFCCWLPRAHLVPASWWIRL